MPGLGRFDIYCAEVAERKHYCSGNDDALIGTPQHVCHELIHIPWTTSPYHNGPHRCACGYEWCNAKEAEGSGVPQDQHPQSR